MSLGTALHGTHAHAADAGTPTAATAAGTGAPADAGKPRGSSVALQGIMGSKAVLVVNGQAPRALGPGESTGSVKVVSVRGEQAVISIDGVQSTLRMGESQSSVAGNSAPRASGQQISMSVDASGHFMADGTINGKSARFMVDTGATTVAMSLADAVKLGVDYRKGRPVQVGTANGVAEGYALKLHSVRIGDVEVYDVDAVVTSQRMPFVLLGNSFLGRFQMRRDADVMVLTRR
jgi:aspartyl protease family protein